MWKRSVLKFVMSFWGIVYCINCILCLTKLVVSKRSNLYSRWEHDNFYFILWIPNQVKLQVIHAKKNFITYWCHLKYIDWNRIFNVNFLSHIYIYGLALNVVQINLLIFRCFKNIIWRRILFLFTAYLSVSFTVTAIGTLITAIWNSQ